MLDFLIEAVAGMFSETFIEAVFIRISDAANEKIKSKPLRIIFYALLLLTAVAVAAALFALIIFAIAFTINRFS